MSAQVIFDDKQAIGREGLNNLFEQLNMAVAVSFATQNKDRFTGSRFKSIIHPDFVTPTVIGFISGSALILDPLRSRIGFGLGPQLIQTNRPSLRGCRQIGRYNEPLFSQTQDHVFVVHGTNSPVCASETLLLRPRSKSLSPIDAHHGVL